MNSTFLKGMLYVPLFALLQTANSSAQCSPDMTNPSIPPLSNITVAGSGSPCGAVVTYATPTFTDNCPNCPQTIAQMTALGHVHLGTFQGHDYYRSATKDFWAQMNATATSLGGYLVTIGSAAEDAFLEANVTDLVWTGMTDQANEGVWVWANGEPVTYTNWCNSQPDDWLGNEDFMALNSQGVSGPPGCWDDIHSGMNAPLGIQNVIYGIIEMPACGSIQLIAGLPSGSTFPGGTTTVTYEAKDGAGNSTTESFTVTVACPPSTPQGCITVTPSNNTYTGGIPTNIYLGYGPQSATLTANPTGPGPHTYLWTGPTSALSCTNCQSPVFTPVNPGTYTFTVLITNSDNTTTTCSITFCVKDIQVPSNNNNPNSQKVYLCHVPPGNPANAHTLSISINAVPAHLGNHTGDALGQCGQTCGANQRMIRPEEVIDADEVKIFPSPNNGSFVIELPYIEDQAVLTVSDMQGRVIQQKTVIDGESRKVRFDLGNVARGLYLVDVTNGEHKIRTKLVVQ